MNYQSLSRGVWNKIFRMLPFLDQLIVRQLSKYFTAFSIKHIPTKYLYRDCDLSRFSDIEHIWLIKQVNIDSLSQLENLVAKDVTNIRLSNHPILRSVTLNNSPINLVCNLNYLRSLTLTMVDDVLISNVKNIKSIALEKCRNIFIDAPSLEELYLNIHKSIDLNQFPKLRCFTGYKCDHVNFGSMSEIRTLLILNYNGLINIDNVPYLWKLGLTCCKNVSLGKLDNLSEIRLFKIDTSINLEKYGKLKKLTLTYFAGTISGTSSSVEILEFHNAKTLYKDYASQFPNLTKLVSSDSCIDIDQLGLLKHKLKNLNIMIFKKTHLDLREFRRLRSLAVWGDTEINIDHLKLLKLSLAHKIVVSQLPTSLRGLKLVNNCNITNIDYLISLDCLILIDGTLITDVSMLPSLKKIGIKNIVTVPTYNTVLCRVLKIR